VDNGGQLKVAGFGLIRLCKMAPDKAKLAQPGADCSSKFLCTPYLLHWIFYIF
jgi:hypothetical protein